MDIQDWTITNNFSQSSYLIQAFVREAGGVWEWRTQSVTREELQGGRIQDGWVGAVLRVTHPDPDSRAEWSRGSSAPTLPPSDHGLTGHYPLEEMSWPAPEPEEVPWAEQNRKINALIARRA